MSLEKTLKLQICIQERTPYFPIGELMRLTSTLGVSRAQVVDKLDQLQEELGVEAEAIRKSSGNRSSAAVQHEYWCFYCAQAQVHYRMLTHSDASLH